MCFLIGVCNLDLETALWINISFSLACSFTVPLLIPLLSFPFSHCFYFSPRFSAVRALFDSSLVFVPSTCLSSFHRSIKISTPGTISWADCSLLQNLINTTLLSEPRGKTHGKTKKREGDELKRKYLSYYTSNISTPLSHTHIHTHTYTHTHTHTHNAPTKLTQEAWFYNLCTYALSGQWSLSSGEWKRASEIEILWYHRLQRGWDYQLPSYSLTDIRVSQTNTYQDQHINTFQAYFSIIRNDDTNYINQYTEFTVSSHHKTQ